ncbi:uncharacterized protein LOC131034411 isoform X2 [Cryptomeria japonica]|uniref:uncharacterized protein LOC131034411 isoform X2 n=1 Tax=Cryptomeria japonica TaxID=3369 RepID=UPI0027DA4968|nr:uncharacterized protein LOC131034411 isoform X2 [Cryptomeria japonica]
MKSKAVMISPKKLSSGEYSQAMRSTEETTELGTNESSQANKLTGGDHAQKFLAKDVFLSHSGAQKNFVRQLHRDLTNQGVSCFFDEDPESLPLGEDFPPCIFEAAETCRVAVLLLSKEFLETKWPMQELCTFVKARDKTRTNPNLKILPLFFMIPPKALKQFKADNEKWKEFEKSEEKRAEWEQALNAIRRINGLKFSEGSDEVEFRDKIVKEIWRKLPTHSLRYHVPCMQGEERMCQEVADFFNSVQPNEKGIRIAGLYGIAGHGKTTLGKAFCNLNLGVRSAFYRVRRACTPPRAMSLTGNSPKVWQFCFEGKICHLEFSRGDSLERIKLALQYLTYCPQSHLQTLTSQEQAQVELYKRVKGQTVLLVLDNITEESVDEVRYYVEADFRKNSCILLSARSVDVLVKHCKIDSKSCMRVPSLEKDEALGILLEGTSLQESSLGAEDKAFALKCANRCSFKEISNDIVRRDRTFHPLALKAFGGHLFSKYGSNLAKWVTEIDGLVDQSGYGLDDVFAVLGKAFDDIRPKYRTIFMLLTVYMLPNMSPDKVTLWLAIICNEEISFVEKAVEDLCKKAFIEEFEPEIRIHDLYIEFAQSKAKEMGRWLWWKGDGRSTRGLISQENGGFELAKLEQCVYRSPTQIAPKYLKNLLVLQLIGVQNMRKLDLGRMDSLRSITLHDCQVLAALDGMENLLDLAWLQIRGVNPLLKLPEVSSLLGLQYLEIDIAVSQVLNQLGDLTPCFNLREINVRCPSLLDFPKLNGLPHLEKVEFNVCDKVKGPLDCTDCVELQSIVLNSCCQMAASPLLAGCKKPSKIVLWECDAVTACPDIYLPSALKILELFISSKAASVPKSLEYCYGLENLQLWNMGELKELPSFRFLSNLTVLKLGKCGIREPPDLTCCVMLEDVYFFTLKNLERFPNFSSLRKLKKLSLYNCRRVQDPPDISGCHQLQVLHIVYNDKMEGLPNMGQCSRLEEIKLSWPSENEVTYEGIDPDSCEVDDDDESWLEHFKDENFPSLSDVSAPEVLKEWPWLKDKTTLVKRYFRGVRLYYSITVPYESYERRQYWGQATPEAITLQIVDGMVVPLPTHRMVAGPWTETVRKYFAGKKDIVRASAPSVSYVAILRLLAPPSPRYRLPVMHGEARMCQEVADFFTIVPPNDKGIRIAGLYGMLGMGKTTLGKAFCNLSLGNFDGKVCYLEFCGGKTLDRQKLALQYLTDCHKSQLESLTSEDEAQKEFYKRVRGQRVLLVLDNIETEEIIDEVIDYLQAELGKNSCILLSTRSVYLLRIIRHSCMHVPSLTEGEAIAILLERTTLQESTLGAEDRGFALKCANRCSFQEDTRYSPKFHPLALKVFGRHLFGKYGSNLSKWIDEIDDSVDTLEEHAQPAYWKLYWNQNFQYYWNQDLQDIQPVYWNQDSLFVGVSPRVNNGYIDSNNTPAIQSRYDVFSVLGRAFDGMEPTYRTIFMLLIVYALPNISPHEVTEWLAINCNEEIKYIKKAVEDLCENAFIEEMHVSEIRIHDLIKEFAKCKAETDDEAGGVKFRDEIIRAIFRLLPAPSQRYHVSAMQGEARMCQEIADFFKHVQPNEKGIRIAGLYGMEGMGKTTLCKAFCNLKLEDFDGKVYHIEFCRGNSLDRENPALTNLQSELQELASEYQGQRVLLVLDNIETEESTDDVRYCLQADLGENSCILLSARSVDVLIKNFNIDSESCMSIPGLEEEEAISILLERTSPAESAMAAENRGFALQCANICSFKETSRGIIGGAHTFHPLALKTFGRYLFSKYRSDLSKWVAEIDGLVVGSSDGLDDVFTVLDRVFDDMNPKYCTIFMLLTVYMLPKMSLHKVTEWLAINCNEEIEYIEKAVEDLWQKAFIEEIKPEIRIHDLFMEFGQSKARKMGRWLWCKDDLITSESKLFSKDEAGFELAKLEHCRQRDLSQIGDKYVENLWALQVVDGEMNHLRFSSMKNIRSLILHNCEFLEVLQGMENLPGLAWLQIRQVPMLKFVKLNSLTALQHLEIDIGYSGGPTELGDLAGCVSLREIYVRCPFLLKFPRINGLPYLEKAKFQELSVIGPLDCAACVKLQSIDFEYCWQMVHIPLIDGCSNLSKIVLNMCDQVTECSDKEESSALEIKELCISSEDPWAPRHSFCCDGLNNLPLWNIVIMDVPSLRRLSNLTVLKLYDCDISEPPDVTCCSMLEDVCFFTLQYLKSFPNFSSLRKLKNLCLCNCGSVRAPPDIGGCHELRVFHLLYNDNMKGLPMMDGCPLLDEIKLSWLSSEEILYYSDSYEDDDLEFCLDYQKDEIFPNLNDVFMPVELKEWQWMQGKRVRVKQYFRREKVYYSIAATCESYDRNGTRDSLEQVIIHRASTISDEDEVRFIDKVTRAISRLIPPKIRFPYSSMQEEEATLIWPAKAVRFKPLSPTVTGIHIAGLYQTEDNQKTILRESFFKFILKGFEGGVSSLEFSAGNSMERLDNALKYLTHSPGLKMRLPTSEFLDQDAFSKGPTFNIMMLLIRYPIPDKFMDDNLMDIARDFHINWAGNTRIVFHSQRYTIIEFSRH